MVIRLLFILLLTGCAAQKKSVTVNLDGSNSYGFGIGYSWKQIYGIPVTINNPNNVKVSFSVNKPGIYKFELTVMDKNGLTDSDTVMVTTAIR